MNIYKLPVIFLRDYNKEFFDLPPNTYLGFSPVAPLKKSIYKTIRPDKKDSLCYIKHKEKDEWAYKINNKIVFMPLQIDKKTLGNTLYKPPCVFWLEYISETQFVLYQNVGYGSPIIIYLKYNNELNKKFIDSLEWVSYFNEATVFSFSQVGWDDFLNQNVFSRYNISL